MLISLTMRSPLTNTGEMRKICSESAQFAQTFIKSLRVWEIVESIGRKKPPRPLGEGVGGGVRTGSKTDTVNRKNYLRHRGRLTAKHLHIVPIVPLLRGGDRGGGSPFALQRAGFWGPCKVVRPCGERRTHRSGEGCPQCNGGSARLKRRLRPTSRRRLPLERICAQYGFVFCSRRKTTFVSSAAKRRGFLGQQP